MKTLFFVLGILLVIFIIVQIYTMNAQRTIETYPYTVIKKYENFEIRDYEASLFTSVELSTSAYKESSSKGFSILAGYIFGANERKEKISMTSPVSMSLEDSMTMMFMVPKKFNKENLPAPNQSGIEFKEEPAKTLAAITFGGWADDAKIEKYKIRLKTSLEAEDIAYTNRFYFFGYNSPAEVFNHKNEIVAELHPTVLKH